MTPDAAADRPAEPMLDWLKGLLPGQEPDSWLAASDERLRRLEAEAERARREAEGQ